MARLFSSSPEDVIESLESQLASLRREVKSLRRSAARHGASAYEDASDSISNVYDEIAHRVRDAVPPLRKTAYRVERRARENPAATAAIGLVALGVLAALLVRR